MTKLFHFARADLATIYRYLGVIPTPIMHQNSFRTRSVFHRPPRVKRIKPRPDRRRFIERTAKTSDWGAPTLTPDQLTYAASDVLYLHRLKTKLDTMLVRENRTELARKLMDFLPIRAELDVAGWHDIDVFSHKPTRKLD